MKARHAYMKASPLTLSANGPVTQDSHSFAYVITHPFHPDLLFPLFPLLGVVQYRVLVTVHEVHHDDPFGNLGAVNA